MRAHAHADGTVALLMVLSQAGSLRSFPAKTWWVLQSDLRDGRRVMTAALSGASGFTLPRTRTLAFPGVVPLGELLDVHRRELVRELREGEAPETLELAEIVACLQQQGAEAHELRARRGYVTWGDALRRWYGFVHPAHRPRTG